MKTVTEREVDAAFASYKNNRSAQTLDRLMALIAAYMATR